MNDRSIYPLGRRRTLVVLTGTLLGMLLASINQTLAATAMPKIVGELGGLGHYSWVFSAYTLGATLTIPLYGKLSDLYGRRPLFLTAISLFSVGSVVAGLAPSMPVLVAGRALQGIGAGGLVPLGIAVIAVPANSAQHVLNLVVAAGIKAVLNFSPGTLEVPSDIKLKSVDLTVSLESLSFFLAQGDGEDR